MILSIRLQKILSMISQCQSLLDIGSDHALLCIEAIRQNIAKQCIAADNKEGPLARAYKNIQEANLESYISTSLSDGAQNIDVDCDCWVIAGMGAELMIKILDDSQQKSTQTKQIILCPHSKPFLLKKHLLETGYHIIDQQLVYDRKYYIVFKAVFTGDYKQIEMADLHFDGFIKDDLYYKWIKHQTNHYKKLSMVNTEYVVTYQLYKNEYLKYK